jgi:mono/diheme cytochrome c family protein
MMFNLTFLLWRITLDAQPQGRLRSMISRISALIGVAVLGLALADCGGAPTPTPPPSLDPGTPAGRGQFLFEANCAACHALVDGVVLSGPSLAHIAVTAQTRIEGMTAEDYIRESIVNPDAYAIKGFQAGLMRQDFSRSLTSDEVNDLVAFLMTQK